MDLLQAKHKLIHRIESTSDEILLLELMGVVENYDVVMNLSDEHHALLKERIKRIEEGDADYFNASEEAEKIKKELNDL